MVDKSVKPLQGCICGFFPTTIQKMCAKNACFFHQKFPTPVYSGF